MHGVDLVLHWLGLSKDKNASSADSFHETNITDLINTGVNDVGMAESKLHTI